MTSLSIIRSALFCICVSAIIFACSANNHASPDASQGDSTVNLMSYNTEDAKNFSEREIAFTINSQRPDFVALQEARNIGGDLSRLTGLHYNSGTASKALLSPGPLHHESHDLMESRWSRTLDIYYNECMAIANMHMEAGSEGESERFQQVQRAMEIIEEFDQDRVLIMGDLNAIPEWESVEYIKDHGFYDISQDQPTISVGTDYAAKIDYIFANERLDHRTWVPQIDTSDHRPVVTAIEESDLCTR